MATNNCKALLVGGATDRTAARIGVNRAGATKKYPRKLYVSIEDAGGCVIHVWMTQAAIDDLIKQLSPKPRRAHNTPFYISPSTHGY
jgi:hypothetical protein